MLLARQQASTPTIPQEEGDFSDSLGIVVSGADWAGGLEGWEAGGQHYLPSFCPRTVCLLFCCPCPRRHPICCFPSPPSLPCQYSIPYTFYSPTLPTPFPSHSLGFRWWGCIFPHHSNCLWLCGCLLCCVPALCGSPTLLCLLLPVWTGTGF